MRFRSRLVVSLLLVMVLLAGCTLFGKKEGTAKIAVKLSDGTPILSADVRLVEGSKEITKGTTNAQGIVELSAKPGSYKVEVKIEAVNQLVTAEDEVAIESTKTTTKDVVVQDLARLDVDFVGKYDVELTVATAVLKDGKDLEVAKSDVSKISFLLKPGTYSIEASADGEKVETFEIAVTAGGNSKKLSLPVAARTNAAKGKMYRMLKLPREEYPDSGGELTDGAIPGNGFRADGWVGTWGQGEGQAQGVWWQVLVVDLGAEQEVIETRLYNLRSEDVGILTIKGVTVALSSDGVEWEVFDKVDYTFSGTPEVHTVVYELPEDARGRFVAFFINQSSNWLFLGEIEIDVAVGGEETVEGDVQAIDLTSIFEIEN